MVAQQQREPREPREPLDYLEALERFNNYQCPRCGIERGERRGYEYRKRSGDYHCHTCKESWNPEKVLALKPAGFEQAQPKTSHQQKRSLLGRLLGL